jgi:hypothetical protein
MQPGLGKIEGSKSIEEMARELSIELDNNRLNESSFINENLPGYRKDEIERDIKEARLKKKNDYYEISGGTKSEAEIAIEKGFEAAVMRAFRESGLFKNAEVVSTTDSDDRKFGVDTIVLEKKDKEPSAFGISLDVTTAQGLKNVKKKVDRNFDNAIKNNFRQPKYVLRNKSLEEQPKLPVGVYACSKENAKIFIKAVYEKNKKIQAEFFALFISQYKLFLQTARATTDFLQETGEYETKKNAIKSQMILIEVSSYLETNINRELVADKVPLYLQSDSANKVLEDILHHKKQEVSAQYLLEKKLTKK